MSRGSELMNRARIMIVVDKMSVGGSEKISVALANAFARSDHPCMVLVLDRDISATEYLDKHSIFIRTATRKFKFDPRYLNKIRNVVADFNPDVIICQALFSYVSVDIACRLMNRIPTILTLHYTHNTTVKDEIFDQFYFCLVRAHCDRIVAIYQKQLLHFSEKHRIPLNRFVCINNGIDTNYFTVDGSKAMNEFTIVHVANIRTEKDQMTLLRSLREVNLHLSNWRLIFCGRDPMNFKPRFVDYLCEQRILDKVEFIDFVDDVRALLRRSDVFVLSSISEALPVAALEAMAMGVPCILTDVGGCSEVVDSEVNGFLVPPGNPRAIAEKLCLLAEDRTRLEAMRIAAREKVVRNFNLADMVNRYMNLFQETISR